VPDAPACPVSEVVKSACREAALRQHMDRGAPVGILLLAKVDMPLMHGWIDALKAAQICRTD